MYFRPASKNNIEFQSVFQHFAEKSSVERLKSSIVRNIFLCINNTLGPFPNIEATTRTINREQLNQMAEDLRPNLYYGSFNLTKTRTLGYELIWKWTEVTGKFIGCQFWSVEAKHLFETELRARYGETASFDTAWNLAQELCSVRVYGERALNHEHVLPIAQLRKLLSKPLERPEFTNSEKNLATFFERAVFGCVLLKHEHEEIHFRAADWNNSWLRYKDSSIRLAPNPCWTDTQRHAIRAANLL